MTKPTLWSPKSGERGMNDLHDAAYCGDAEAVRAALADSIDVNGQDDNGYTPLHWVADMGCTPGDREEIVLLLLANGAAIEVRDATGRTPLFVACYSGSDGVIRQLVQAGADVEARSASGTPAVVAAAGAGSAEAVDLLLDAGADVNARSRDGSSALDVALAAEFDHVTELLRTRGAV